MESTGKELDNTLSNIQETASANIPPWTIKQPEGLLELHNLKKKNVPTHIPG